MFTSLSRRHLIKPLSSDMKAKPSCLKRTSPIYQFLNFQTQCELKKKKDATEPETRKSRVTSSHNP